MSVWAANFHFQAAFGAARKLLVSLRQLLGTSGRSIPALRKPNGGPRQRNLASREPNRAQTTQSREQTADWIIEKAISHVKTTLSSSRSAWSRSRRRRGRRPHGMLEFAANVLIIDVEL